ncbi:site-2 protease family protein [Actinomadura sp. HBU206391]|uniref:site-2 protease family protein n=1 Tax=Actinomadura sp. HBU206391 TaxID=2731692 RepID=UPI00164EEA1B|nr:site-2 protease family protein [Actinomadura sp. HBU206391]MBC6458043.1 site-2 protease family protein [Actinomadura sp. HBU206391]
MGSVHELRGSRANVRLSPVFIAIVAATVLCGLIVWRYGNIVERPARLALFGFVAGAWIVSLCLHEFGHAFFAYRSGDDSIATKGYLTLNPLKYADPILSFAIPVLFMLIGGIGLPGGAIWIERGKIRGRLRHSLISAAGPLANLAFALILAFVVKILAEDDHRIFWSGLAFLTFLQVTAALLNLLPIPGLDGFGIIEPYLPREWARKASEIGGYAFFILIALLWLGPINRVFFDAIYTLTDALGIGRLPIELGHLLFQFWKN